MLRRSRAAPTTFDQEESGRALERLVAFSDGVFAIAMTLLVLNLTVPNLSGSTDRVNEDLWNHLGDQWPELFGYALSFAVIGRYWLVHHRLFRLVRRADSAVLVWNLLLLGFIALIPWPTEMLGRYSDTTAAVVAYSIVLCATGFSSFGLARHIYAAGLLDPRVTDSYKRSSLVRAFVIPIGFAIGIPFAFISPIAGMYAWWISIFVFSFAMRRRFGAAASEPYGRDEPTTTGTTEAGGASDP
jgi:uncharacterized membrane protein